MMGKHICMIEDNPGVTKLNSRALERKGFIVHAASTLAGGLALLRGQRMDLVLLDILLPDGNGLDALPEVRALTDAPVLMLTSLRGSGDIVEGLLRGADEYMTKPYRVDELLARVVAMLRREEARSATLLRRGELMLDAVSGQAFLRGGDLLLTPKDFALLLLLARNMGAWLPRERIYREVWNAPMAGDDTALKSAVYRLRKKLADSGLALKMRRGEGYRLIEE